MRPAPHAVRHELIPLTEHGIVQDLEVVGSAFISREGISSDSASHADILSLGSNTEEEGEDLFYASDTSSGDSSYSFSPPLRADWYAFRLGPPVRSYYAWLMA